MTTTRTWIWGVLAVAVAGVLYARHAGRARPAAAPVATEAAASAVAAGPVSLEPAPPTAARPRLLDLGAGKCVPCKMMAPILDELRQTYTGRFDVVFIDVWERPEAAEPYRINLIPTQIFFDAAGHELFRHEGFFSRDDILATWRRLGVPLDAEASPHGTPVQHTIPGG